MVTCGVRNSLTLFLTNESWKQCCKKLFFISFTQSARFLHTDVFITRLRRVVAVKDPTHIPYCISTNETCRRSDCAHYFVLHHHINGRTVTLVSTDLTQNVLSRAATLGCCRFVTVDVLHMYLQLQFLWCGFCCKLLMSHRSLSVFGLLALSILCGVGLASFPQVVLPSSLLLSLGACAPQSTRRNHHWSQEEKEGSTTHFKRGETFTRTKEGNERNTKRKETEYADTTSGRKPNSTTQKRR